MVTWSHLHSPQLGNMGVYGSCLRSRCYALYIRGLLTSILTTPRKELVFVFLFPKGLGLGREARIKW